MANRRPHGYWSAKRKARVLEYLTTHNHQETLNHYRISGSMLAEWRRQAGGHAAAHGLAHPDEHAKPNGTQRTALIHLHRYVRSIAMPPTDKDLDVLLAIRALQGK